MKHRKHGSGAAVAGALVIGALVLAGGKKSTVEAVEDPFTCRDPSSAFDGTKMSSLEASTLTAGDTVTLHVGQGALAGAAVEAVVISRTGLLLNLQVSKVLKYRTGWKEGQKDPVGEKLICSQDAIWSSVKSGFTPVAYKADPKPADKPDVTLGPVMKQIDISTAAPGSFAAKWGPGSGAWKELLVSNSSLHVVYHHPQWPAPSPDYSTSSYTPGTTGSGWWDSNASGSDSQSLKPWDLGQWVQLPASWGGSPGGVTV